MARDRTIFVQIIDGDECQEGILGEHLGRPAQLRRRPLPSPCLREKLGVAARLLERHKRLLRLLARAVYLFPLLLIAKGAMCALGRPEGDWITVGFVGLVILFFLAISVYLLLFAFAGPPSQRRRGWLLRRLVTAGDPDTPVAQGDQLKLLLEAAPGEDEPINTSRRVRGKARAWSCQEGPLLTDLWSEQEGRVLRVTAARAFLLEAEGQPPMVVAAGVPLLAGEYQSAEPGPDEESLALARLREELGWPRSGEAMRASIAEGSWLELEVPRWKPIRSLEDLIVDGVGYTPEAGKRAAPYRGGSSQRALLALPTDEQPIVIRIDQPVKL